MNARSWFAVAMFLCTGAVSAAETTHGRRLTPNDVDLWQSGGYLYDGSGNIYAIGADSFAYDRADRITSAAVSSHSQTFTYDVFGNVRQIVTGADVLTPAVDILTNRIGATANGPGIVSVATYDGAGNMISRDGIFTYTYDALNMVTSLNGAGQDEAYVYGPGEERIATVTAIHAVAPHWSWTIRDGGRVLRRLENTTWSEDYVYRNGGILATVQSDHTTRHFHLDHLGSARVITNDEGRTVVRHDYYPFGAEIDASPNDAERVRFTGHERDASLYYMHARFYGDMAARFLTADDHVATEAVHAPQRWNRYSYAADNPVRYTDPDGRDVFLRDFSDQDRKKLIAQLQLKTGLQLDVRDGKLVEIGPLKGALGNTSAIARADLRNAMASGRTFTVYSVTGGKAMAERQGPLINMNMERISQVNTHGLAAETMDASMILMHELLGHALKGLHDPAASMLRQVPSMRGETVDYDNKIRTELGLPERRQYLTQTRSNGTFFIPFQGANVDVPEPETAH
jgi:RHS repeat-associated protein